MKSKQKKGGVTFFKKINVYLFIFERESKGGAERERERENPKEAPR